MFLLVSNLQRLTIGCEQLGGVDWGNYDLNDVSSGISCALNNDIFSFDTSDIYGLGKSESSLGKILSNHSPNNYSCDFEIITKGGLYPNFNDNCSRSTIFKDSSPIQLMKSVDKSLSRLKIDTIPIYLLHWWDEKTSLLDILEFFKYLRKVGKVCDYGFCNLPYKKLLELVPYIDENFWYQDKLSLIERSSLIKFELVKNSLGNTISYGALSQGLLSGNYVLGQNFDVSDRRHRLHHFQQKNSNVNQNQLDDFKLLCSDFHLDQSLVAMNWTLKHDIIDKVIVGCKNVDQVLKAIEAFKMTSCLPDKIFRDLNAIFS